MQGIPQPLTEDEVRELAQVDELRETWMSVQEFEAYLREHWAFKIENYITDGAGYAGVLYVIVWGVPAATVLTRGKDGKLRIEDN